METSSRPLPIGEPYLRGLLLGDCMFYLPVILDVLNEPHKSPADRQVGGNHYKEKSIQPWDVIDAFDLGFYEGNVLKYLLRDKGNKKEDLEKAVHYLEKIIEGLD